MCYTIFKDREIHESCLFRLFWFLVFGTSDVFLMDFYWQVVFVFAYFSRDFSLKWGAWGKVQSFASLSGIFSLGHWVNHQLWG